MVHNREHFEFLNQCWNNGNNPIYVILSIYINAGDILKREFKEIIERDYRALATRYRDHPAVLGISIGNELNSIENIQNPEFWIYLNTLAKMLKGIMPNKIVMTSVVDDSIATIGLGEKHLIDLDVWGINSYRGPSFTDLFSTFEAVSTKPLLIGEMGCPGSYHVPDDVPGPPLGNATAVELPDAAEAAADYLAGNWRDIEAHLDIVSGGFVFEWTDEWWKGISVVTHTASTARGWAFPGKWWDECWFGINAIVVNNRDPLQPNPWNPDILYPRAGYFALRALWTQSQNRSTE